MSTKKTAPPDFRKGDPDGKGLGRIVALLPEAQIVEMLNAAHQGRKLPPDNRKGELGPLATHIRKVMEDNPSVTRTADIVALLDPKIKKGKTKEALRRAVTRAR